jgi:hypothetical protein
MATSCQSLRQEGREAGDKMDKRDGAGARDFELRASGAADLNCRCRPR